MDPLIKCELFADHFSTVFNTTTATTDGAAFAASDIPINMILADVPEITEKALLKAAKRLKTSNAPGPDGIPAVVFKKCISELANPLVKIFNWSLRQG